MNRTNRRSPNTTLLAAAIVCALVSLPAAAADASKAKATTSDTESTSKDAAAAPGAADPAATGADTGDRTARINKVVVKAQKREQAAIEVPLSVTAVDAQRLTKSGATQLEDYSAQVPGMSITSNGGSMQVTLRGISTGLSQAAPTTGVYIDEAPIGSVNSYAVGSGLVPDLDPSELEQIEVLKGPQGTLFGGGAMGGVLRYVTKLPDFNKVSGSVTLGWNTVEHGSDGSVGRFSLNAPVSDSFAFRISAFRRKDGGFIDNPLGGPLYGLPTDDVNEVTTTGGRIAASWKISDTWRADASWLTQRRDAAGGTWVDVNRATLEPSFGEYQHATPVDEENKVDLDVGNLTIHGQLGSFGFVSATTYQENSADAKGDGSGSWGLVLAVLYANPFPDFTWGVQTHQIVDTKRWSQEFRLENNAFDDKLYYSFGLYYTDEDSSNRIPSFPTINLLTGDSRPITIPGTSIPYPPGFVQAHIDTTYKEVSFFANATYTFNDVFDLQAGIRYGKDKQEYDQLYTGLLFAGFPGGNFALQQDSENNKFQWMLSGRYHPTENNSFYARVATGYRPGGPSAAVPGIVPFPTVVNSDSLISYEAGWKTVAWDDKLSFELSAFHTKWDDIIIQTGLGGVQFFVNGGKAVSQGWEATLGLFPIEGLSLRGTVGYTDAHLTEDTTNVILNAGTPLAHPLGEDGDRLPFVPEWTSSLVADYTWPAFGDWTASIGGSINYTGKRTSDYSGRAGVDVDSYTQYNANLSLQNEHWQFTLYGKNLGDSDGIIYLLDRGTVPLLGIDGAQAGVLRPRTVGLDVTYRF